MADLEVPPYFICPISLQLMKDPVIVSSGVSYDRQSIDCWLSTYDNNTCPVTNRPLADRSLTPNSTLLRLIDSWTMSNSTPKPKPKPVFDSFDILRELVESSKDPHIQMKSLRRIAMLTQEDADCATTCMEKDGITSYVASLITSSNLSVSDRLVGEATATFHLLKPSPESLKQVSESENRELIKTLIQLVLQGSYQSRIHATFLLRSIFKSVDDAYKKDLPPDLFDGVVEILKDQNSSRKATVASLSILMEVLPYEKNRVRAVEAGVVAVIVELLVEEKDERWRCEAMLRVLELLCERAEGRSALAEHPAGVAAVAGKVLRVSAGATERAVRVLVLLLSRVCCGGVVAKEMMEVGGVAKLCMVVQVEGSRKVRQMAKGILGLHMETWGKSPCFLSYCMP